MAKYVFPAVFEKEGDWYNVTFPDVEGCHTAGKGLPEAVDMAKDALCLMLYHLEEGGKTVPKPSDIRSVQCGKEAFVSLVDCDTLEYRRFYDSKSVKKTLTIPSWLNTMSEKADVNFSAVLQNALKKELHIQ